MAIDLKTSEGGFIQAQDHITPVSPTTASETSEQQHAQLEGGEGNDTQFNRIPGLQPWRRALIFVRHVAVSSCIDEHITDMSFAVSSWACSSP